jgi:phosphonate transport system permease protein
MGNKQLVNYQLPSKKFTHKLILNGIIFASISAICYYLNFYPWIIFSEFHFLKDLIGEMFPPSLSIFWENSAIFTSILQTLAMAFLGTFFGCGIGTLLAFLSANNVMPNKYIRNIIKFILTVIRVIPSLVVILIFVITVGPGSFAGVLTLFVITIGTFGKLLTEVLENTDLKPSEAIFSVGATNLQVIRFSIIPQILPTFITNFLYSFDLNMRVSIGLGIFGGGGIGYKLYLAMRVLHYKDALALIACIVLMVLIIERLSNFLRLKIVTN